MRFGAVAAFGVVAGCGALAAAAASVDVGPRVLFVRGADRSGGFLEANNDFGRTEQLADITNEETFNRNHGWFEFAEALRGAGFFVAQVTEPLGAGDGASGPTAGAVFDFASVPLNTYDVVVMGSNNADYAGAAGEVQVDVLEAYVRRGGAVLFVSDANFGGSWADAPSSDQPFLDRFGWVMQQDRGTYVLRRSDGDFVAADHPILVGVDAMDGEGVSPIVVPEVDTAAGVESLIVIRAKPGQQTRNNDRSPGQGTSRGVTDRDATLAVATVDRGRIAGHFDRNTFFNANGAGSDLGRFDNERYAVNLFEWLADGPGVACRADLDGDGALGSGDVAAGVAFVAAGSGLGEFVAPFGLPDFFDVLELLRLIEADGCE